MTLDGTIELIYSSWASFLSLGFISFVAILLAVKLYIKIRSRFKVLVNCWFCNKNSRVQYENYNSWDCPHCGQYNGFTKDGDYNKDLGNQYVHNNVQFNQRMSPKSKLNKDIRLCQRCNDNQLVKVEKLAEYEPQSDKSFNEDLKEFRDSLEDTYRLCHRCENNVKKVLVEKKKMVLGLHLAQRSAIKVLNQTKKFIKPIHIRASTSSKILQRITSIILIVLATTNWSNVIDDLKLKRENFQEIFDPITTSVLFFLLSHLATFTKVVIKYLSNILNVHLIEKTLLFIRTISFLMAYSLGFNLFAYNKFLTSAFLHSVIPFVCMFLAFGSHFWEGFRVTKNTYLLVLWSVYGFMSNGVASPEYDVYKILTSSLLLIISLPIYNKKNELQEILNTTDNSFHRMHIDDYTPEDASSIMNKSKSIKNNVNLSTSSYNSNRSFSPISLMNKNNLTSSAFNLSTTPASAFKMYSDEQMHNKSNDLFNDSFILGDASKNVRNDKMNTFNQTLLRVKSPLHVDADLNMSRGASTPKSFISCSNSFTQRRNLLSPSHFTNSNISVYTAAYATPAQSPCPSNVGYFYNCDDRLEKQKSYILNNVIPHENISRGSSQSSGFESITGSVVYPPSERFYTYENSIGGGHEDNFNTYAPQLSPVDTMMYNTQFKGPSHLQIKHRNNIFQSKSMDFENGDHWIRNTPKSNRRQAFNADLLKDAKISHMRISNAFDLNGMNSYLPHVRKRCNLLGSENVMRTGIEKELGKVDF